MATVTHRPRILTNEMIQPAVALLKAARPVENVISQSYHAALDKAATRLMTMPWRITEFGNFEIQSYSRPTDVRQASATACGCRGHYQYGQCWHRAAHDIVFCVLASGVHVVAALPLPDMEAIDDIAGIVPTPRLVPAFRTYDDVEAIADLLTVAADLWMDLGLTRREAIREALRVRIAMQPAVVAQVVFSHAAA